jgi:hypothetical protein
MTVEQVIRFDRPFFPRWRDDLERRYMKMFDLPPKRRVDNLSKGTRSKLMLLIAICHGAELLILDEPTDGFDPAAVEDVLRELWQLPHRRERQCAGWRARNMSASGEEQYRSWPPTIWTPLWGRLSRLPGTTIEPFPVGLKEVFLEHVRSDDNALV